MLSVRGLGREGVFRDVNFDVHRGEVLGFAGLIGAGRTDIGLALFGIAPATAGTIVLDGKPRHHPLAPPGDGAWHRLLCPRTAASSACRCRCRSPPTSRCRSSGAISTASASSARRWSATTAESFRRRLAIRTPSVDLPVAKLSGGNQQKVMLSKWLNTHPKLLILDEPTRGIDVGAKAEVHAMISELAAEGIGIIMISSDLPEVLAMSDRVLVMREGRQMAIFDRKDATQESVMTAAMGQAELSEAAA